MSDHETPDSGDASNPNSKVDAISAIVLILLAVSFVVYYVSHL